MAGLFEADPQLSGGGGFRDPFGEQPDPGGGVVEALGAGLRGADHMAEEFGFADIDTEEKARRRGGFNGSFHQWFVCSQRTLKTSRGGGVAVS